MNPFNTLSVSVLTEFRPYFFYRRYPVTGFKVRDSVKVPAGQNAMLRRVIARWDEAGAAFVSPSVFFYATVDNQPIQQDPYPLSVVTTPGPFGETYVASPAPVDATGFGISFSAGLFLFQASYNTPIPASGKFDFELTGFTLAGVLPAGNHPSYVDVLLCIALSPAGVK